jgi:hypothetical protein
MPSPKATEPSVRQDRKNGEFLITEVWRFYLDLETTNPPTIGGNASRGHRVR